MNNEQSRTRPGQNGQTAEHPDNGNGHAIRNHGHQRKAVVITGGAGFIGTNLADRFLSAGTPVILYDNLSRAGVEQNLAWLKEKHGALVRHENGDVRDFEKLRKVVRQASHVFHFAAQVAVTTSLDAPTEDFEINARGTLNLLEAIRALPEPLPLVFTSTNKVYGDLTDIKLQRKSTRYEPTDQEIRHFGFSEQCPLNFHSPYGCSKGAACQYVQDYARTFGLPTVVFRMSCIYGPHQFGTEDQGWVAHFLIKALENSPITIYGDGRQVRDILFVEDLVDAFLLVQKNINKLAGQVFNMGGGAANTTSLLELMKLIEKLHGSAPDVRFSEWRAADQLYYVSDTRKFSQLTGWRSRIDVRAGVEQLYYWLAQYHRQRSERIVRLPLIENSGKSATKRISITTVRARGMSTPRAVPLKKLNGTGTQANGRLVEKKLAKAA